MSHFATLVFLPGDTPFEHVETKLAEVLAPYDENLSVEPYRVYEEGEPGEFWWVRAVQRGAASLAAGEEPEIRTSFLERTPGMVWSSPLGREVTHAEARQYELDGWADDARWAERLGDNPGWQLVAQLYNEKYDLRPDSANDAAVALVGQDVPERDYEALNYDPEADQAYQWSTYSKASRWDWYQVGGRWRNSLVAKDGVDRSALISTEPHWTEKDQAPRWDDGRQRCDGGHLFTIDFDAMRDAVVAEKAARFARWEALSSGFSEQVAWSYFRTVAEAGVIDWAEARKAYRDQPIIAATHEVENSEFAWNCPIDEFSMGREAYLAAAAQNYLPAFAAVNLEGEWIAPGKMGWFGMSDAEEDNVTAFKAGLTEYIKTLDERTLLVVVDCHI